MARRTTQEATQTPSAPEAMATIAGTIVAPEDAAQTSEDTGTALASVAVTHEGVVLTDSQVRAQMDAATQSARDSVWSEYLALPGDVDPEKRREILARAASLGDIDAGDAVRQAEHDLTQATGLWAHTGRVVHAMLTVAAGSSRSDSEYGPGHMTPAEVVATFGEAPDDASENAVRRMGRGWALVLADNATGKTGDSLRPYIAAGNRIAASKMPEAIAAVKSGKSMTAVWAQIRGDKAITAKTTGTPRGTNDTASATARADVAAQAAPKPKTLDVVLEDSSDSALAGFFGKVLVREVTRRQWTDPAQREAMALALEAMLAYLVPDSEDDSDPATSEVTA